MSGSGYGSNTPLERRVTDLERRFALQGKEFTVATVPSAAQFKRCWIYVSNGAAGSPVMAFSDGSNWLRCDTLAAISAS